MPSSEFEIHCKEDLRVEGCDRVFRGETPIAVVEEIVQHLRDEHDLELPDADAIVEGKVDAASILEGPMDPGAQVVLERLREKLGLQPREGPGEPRPSIGKASSA